jgi:hypothetical protein
MKKIIKRYVVFYNVDEKRYYEITKINERSITYKRYNTGLHYKTSVRRKDFLARLAMGKYELPNKIDLLLYT